MVSSPGKSRCSDNPEAPPMTHAHGYDKRLQEARQKRPQHAKPRRLQKAREPL
jgi:hypothetical protein